MEDVKNEISSVENPVTVEEVKPEPKKRGPKPKVKIEAESVTSETATATVVEPEVSNEPVPVEAPTVEPEVDKSIPATLSSKICDKPINIYNGPDTATNSNQFIGALSYVTINMNGFYPVTYKVPGAGGMVKGYAKIADLS